MLLQHRRQHVPEQHGRRFELQLQQQIAEGGKKGTVMVVDAKNIAHPKEVEIGETIEGRVRIVSGLQGGETLITEGGYGLPDGVEVHVAKEKQQ